MHVQSLGHVVLKVRDLKRSEDFYSGTLGMRIVLRLSDPRMTFFTIETTENHHDFALMELGFDAPLPGDDTTGLAHVAFKIGTSADEFGRARSELHDSGTHILYEADRTFTKSMHVLDPDGNEIELYVDASAARREPTGKGLLESHGQPDPHSLQGSS